MYSNQKRAVHLKEREIAKIPKDRYKNLQGSRSIPACAEESFNEEGLSQVSPKNGSVDSEGLSFLDENRFIVFSNIGLLVIQNVRHKIKDCVFSHPGALKLGPELGTIKEWVNF